MSSPTKTILVTGATGKQGGAVITSLLSSTQPFKIIALTRNSSSPVSKLLATKPNISLLQGDLNDCPSIFSQLPSDLYGVFSVQIALKPKLEEPQGNALIDEAAKHGVKHFIYSSVDRGGEKSDTTPTPVPTFATKHRIEKHLQDSTLEWTIIRPTGFMDNFAPDIPGKGMVAMWKLSKPESRMQMVACKDIGRFAALAFEKPEEFKGRKISLAGDDLCWEEMNEVYKKVFGTGIPTTYGWVGSVLRSVFYDLLGRMFEWLESDGFRANVKECRRMMPDILTFEKWLREESRYRKK